MGGRRHIVIAQLENLRVGEKSDTALVASYPPPSERCADRTACGDTHWKCTNTASMHAPPHMLCWVRSARTQPPWGCVHAGNVGIDNSLSVLECLQGSVLALSLCACMRERERDLSLALTCSLSPSLSRAFSLFCSLSLALSLSLPLYLSLAFARARALSRSLALSLSLLLSLCHALSPSLCSPLSLSPVREPRVGRRPPLARIRGAGPDTRRGGAGGVQGGPFARGAQ